MNNQFYLAFEEKYRGSRELIAERLHVYLPFIRPLLQTYPEGQAIDLGCGRGEWLELLIEEGFKPEGVDLDEGMLSACHQLGLPVVKADAIDFLSKTESNSQLVVSAFHVVEHISFEQLRALVIQAFRVLKPGGLLILESPNPENIEVSTSNFYLDPTHQRPIPPQLLEFVAGFEGFEQVKILRLQEPKKIASCENIGITELIQCVSPDYSVIAQKKADKSLSEKSQYLFDAEYGVSLNALSLKLDQRLARIEYQSVRALQLSQQAEVKAQQAEVKAQQAELIFTSKSWRITFPLRCVAQLFRQLRAKGIVNQFKVLLKIITIRMLSEANNLPGFKYSLKILEIWFGIQDNLRPNIGGKAVKKRMEMESIVKLHPRAIPSTPIIPEALNLSHSFGINESKRWVRLTGHIEGHYSLAIVNRSLAQAFEKVTEGCLSFVPFNGKPYAKAPILTSEQEATLSAPLHRSIPIDCTNETISIVHHYPYIVDDQPAKFRGILFFWEETSVPFDTIRHINQNFNIVWVAALSVKRSLINSGCHLPIFVIPIGIDHLIGPHVKPIENIRVAKDQRFRILHVSSAFERKGIDILLSAYLNEFNANDNVELYIKTFPNPHNQIHGLYNSLVARLGNKARVIIDESPLDEVAMLKLYQSAHVMVLPTRGEGFNLPAAEALAIGLPVITTGYSAQVDFCTGETSTLIDFYFELSKSHLRSGDSCWTVPNENDLKLKLRKTFERISSNDPLLNTQREFGIRHVRQVYSWKNSVDAIFQSIDYVNAHPFDIKMPLSVSLLTSWDVRCGIAEYSKSLFEPLVKTGAIDLTVYCDNRVIKSSDNIIPCWDIFPAENIGVLNVVKLFCKSDSAVLYLQHHPGFYSLTESLCAQMIEAQLMGKVVILELHSTLPLLQEFKPSEIVVDYLSKLDRIIVHKPEDLNNLLQLGLVNNVMMLPIGVMNPPDEMNEKTIREKFGIPVNSLVIGSFGFALPHKGIDTLIKTIKLLQSKVETEVHLIAVNSVLDNRSEDYIIECKLIAKRLGVEKYIHWVTDYLPIGDSQSILAATDYIIYPYRETRESASAAVTLGLSTLKPVLVSSLDIFSDSKDITFQLEGSQASDISRLILELISKPDLVSIAIQRQETWIHSRSWEILSSRIFSLMVSFTRLRFNN